MPLCRDLADSVIVLTGASGGIGAATAEALARRGASLVLAARRPEALHAVAERCRAVGGRTLVIPTDVTCAAAVEDLAAEAAETFGHLDAWVNNAGVAMYGPLYSAPLPQARRVVETNLLGTLYGARAAIPHLRTAGGGVVVNVASVLGVVSVPYLGMYNVTKHAVLGLSDTLRQDLTVAGERRVSVCTVLPASIDTPFYRHAGNRTGRPLQPLPPMYRPELVAQTIVATIERPRRQAYAGLAGRLLAAQWRLLPGPTEQVLRWYAERATFEPGTVPDTDGNLFTPSDQPPTVDGGYRTRRGAALRTAAVSVALGFGVAALARKGLTGR